MSSRAGLIAAIAMIFTACTAQDYYRATSEQGKLCISDCYQARLQCGQKVLGNDLREHECWRAHATCLDACPDVQYVGSHPPNPVGGK